MPNQISHQPRSVHQVMVSSTFLDLKDHRAALIEALHKHKLHANVMEFDDARLDHDVIDSSLQMVRDSAAYILVIGFKYGQTPECSQRNPDQLSVTEMEFLEAQRLGRPILLFLMDDDHPVTKKDIENVSWKEEKLDAFRERAKKKDPNGAVNRVYSVFKSVADFKDKIGSSLTELCQHLASSVDESQSEPPRRKPAPGDRTAIPEPPAFYAEPDYIGSHQFVGRVRELEELSDWARPADPTNLLLFEAIGGNGKSMLTWEWTKNHVMQVRQDWAGRFWYSFYEQGAVMADFCQRALSYMTGQPLAELRKKKTAELKEPLLAQLHAKPWLLILDGLERVLVAYHRIDAAELPDEEANHPTDKIAHRNPCDAIRDEDNDLLRALAAAAPSKILVSSRLTPRVLLNPSGQAISGAKRITLPGLRPADAEQLLRSCNIEGDSMAIQNYLATSCDNHPLVIGILGGLIRNYLPARGNFNAWAADPNGVGKLDLASLDLVQRRNHILRAALESLPIESHQLLSTLALLSDSVDYETLSALNPLKPPEANKLSEIVADLEQRGLLQYDGHTRRYDLHPVVRGVAVGEIMSEDKQRFGQRVIDHFASLPHDPYEEAETLEHLRPSLNVIRTLLNLGHFQEAADAYRVDISNAILFNVEAHVEALSLLRPFFPDGWAVRPSGVDMLEVVYLTNVAGISLSYLGETDAGISAFVTSLSASLEVEQWERVYTLLRNLGLAFSDHHGLAKSISLNELALDLAILLDAQDALFMGKLDRFTYKSVVGKWNDADLLWRQLDEMGRGWSRSIYRPGMAEYLYARHQYRQGILEEKYLAIAERLASEGKNRVSLRSLCLLRGEWRLDQMEWQLAAVSFSEAIRMARESGIPDAVSETGLALAKFHLGQLAESRQEAERLANFRNPANRRLAQLWLAIGDREKAKYHALAAYHWAWADGEPYVHRFELTKTTELLNQMNVPIPDLPPYDPAKDEPFPWEAEVRAAIEKLRAEKQAEDSAEDESE